MAAPGQSTPSPSLSGPHPDLAVEAARLLASLPGDLPGRSEATGEQLGLAACARWLASRRGDAEAAREALAVHVVWREAWLGTVAAAASDDHPPWERTGRAAALARQAVEGTLTCAPAVGSPSPPPIALQGPTRDGAPSFSPRSPVLAFQAAALASSGGSSAAIDRQRVAIARVMDLACLLADAAPPEAGDGGGEGSESGSKGAREGLEGGRERVPLPPAAPAPPPQGRVVVLVDASSVPLSQARALVRSLLAVIEVMQAHYPERLGLLAILRPPRAFAAAWKVVQPALAPTTRARVAVDSPELRERLRRALGPRGTPASAGGDAPLLWPDEGVAEYSLGPEGAPRPPSASPRGVSAAAVATAPLPHGAASPPRLPLPASTPPMSHAVWLPSSAIATPQQHPLHRRLPHQRHLIEGYPRRATRAEDGRLSPSPGPGGGDAATPPSRGKGSEPTLASSRAPSPTSAGSPTPPTASAGSSAPPPGLALRSPARAALLTALVAASALLRPLLDNPGRAAAGLLLAALLLRALITHFWPAFGAAALLDLTPRLRRTATHTSLALAIRARTVADPSRSAGGGRSHGRGLGAAPQPLR